MVNQYAIGVRNLSLPASSPREISVFRSMHLCIVARARTHFLLGIPSKFTFWSLGAPFVLFSKLFPPFHQNFSNYRGNEQKHLRNVAFSQ